MKTKILPNTFLSVEALFASVRLLASAIMSILMLDVLALSATGTTITTFDVPGAGTDPFQGTFPFAINPAGTITGYYVDAGYVPHSFLRDNRGTITTFDVPSAESTAATAINPAGTITGYYVDAGYVPHGFLRVF